MVARPFFIKEATIAFKLLKSAGTIPLETEQSTSFVTEGPTNTILLDILMSFRCPL